MIRHAALIGFGEVGSIFARDLLKAGVTQISAYDVLFSDSASTPSRHAKELGVTPSANAVDAVNGADLVICAVTAENDLEAAQGALSGLSHGPFFLDVNSVSPETKRQAAALVEKSGGRFVEAAVMSSVPPKGLGSPMLLGGPHAQAFIAGTEGMGMDLTAYSDEIGTASAVKMCRSVLIKGLEALMIESMLAARYYGVEKDVLGSLHDTLPHDDREKFARYLISRALMHGKRRAEEVREVVHTVRQAGVEPLMSTQTAVRQDWAAVKGKKLSRDELLGGSLETLLASMD